MLIILNGRIMNAQDLRIGSYLFKNGEVVKIVEIGIKHKGDTNYYLRSENDNCGYWIDQFKPIPLTEEILLSIKGAKQLNEWQYKLNDWFVIERYTTKDKWSIRKVISEDSSILLCFIDFLHEFQNLYFALTGKELEIGLWKN